MEGFYKNSYGRVQVSSSNEKYYLYILDSPVCLTFNRLSKLVWYLEYFRYRKEWHDDDSTGA